MKGLPCADNFASGLDAFHQTERHQQQSFSPESDDFREHPTAPSVRPYFAYLADHSCRAVRFDDKADDLRYPAVDSDRIEPTEQGSVGAKVDGSRRRKVVRSQFNHYAASWVNAAKALRNSESWVLTRASIVPPSVSTTQPPGDTRRSSMISSRSMPSTSVRRSLLDARSGSRSDAFNRMMIRLDSIDRRRALRTVWIAMSLFRLAWSL